MSMSTYVVGIKPADDHWQRMKAAWDACSALNIDPPDSVVAFFDGEEPDSAGVTVLLSGHHMSVRPYKNDYSEGFEVDLKNLPRDVTVLRFVNSW